MIVFMSYLGLCFWHYCAWEHLCLWYCRRYGGDRGHSRQRTID